LTSAEDVVGRFQPSQRVGLVLRLQDIAGFNIPD